MPALHTTSARRYSSTYKSLRSFTSTEVNLVDPSQRCGTWPVTLRGRSRLPLYDPYPPFGTSWQAARIVVQAAREWMFCHVSPIRMPCSSSLACCPVDLICRDECMLCLPLRVRIPGGYLRSSGAVGMSSQAPGRLARRCDISGESSRGLREEAQANCNPSVTIQRLP